MSNLQSELEILAPAGSMESLITAVRAGANAVYLGGKSLNARQSASNFDSLELKEAVRYCHARNVNVHYTLNTLVFEDELPVVMQALQEACEAGVDALIVQDLAVAALAKRCAPDMTLHASTQLAVCDLNGVLTAAELGFSRVVLARELTKDEIAFICKKSPIGIECFIHGALCMSISGQCYLSAMIGGRSGNRGRCAQPCRLPFSSQDSSHALSLRDLSLIDQIQQMEELGVCSVKIEGRQKRPEYVGAAVKACIEAKDGLKPDYQNLQNVFSRSGFTNGYFSSQLGEDMFGTRRKEDVVAAKESLQQLTPLYRNETPLVPLSAQFTMQPNRPITLTIQDAQQNTVTVTGEAPQPAISAPTTWERAKAALQKTGGTPFFLQDFKADLTPDYMVPASQLNALRRDALEQLLKTRETVSPIPFKPAPLFVGNPVQKQKPPAIWIRIQRLDQLTNKLWEQSERLIVPLSLWSKLPSSVTQQMDKIILELPRFCFSTDYTSLLSEASKAGFSWVLAGNLGGIYPAQQLGLTIVGDCFLNVINTLAADQFHQLGCEHLVLGLEATTESYSLPTTYQKGAIAYGWIPLMAFRNHPAGMNGKDGFLTDRMDKQFFVQREGEVSYLYNSVPLYLGDRSSKLKGLDFSVLRFTRESAQECEDILLKYQSGQPLEIPATHGLSTRRVQ